MAWCCCALVLGEAVDAVGVDSVVSGVGVVVVDSTCQPELLGVVAG